jgi:hypothetical protein
MAVPGSSEGKVKESMDRIFAYIVEAEERKGNFY